MLFGFARAIRSLRLLRNTAIRSSPKRFRMLSTAARKGQPYRLARLNGELLDKNGKKSIYNCENYKYLLDAPFKISARCCYHMKKAPLTNLRGSQDDTRLRVSWPAKASCGSNPGSSLAATASSASGLSVSPLRSGWKKIFCGI